MRKSLIAIAAVSCGLLSGMPISNAQERGPDQSEITGNRQAEENRQNIDVVKGFWQHMWLERNGSAAAKYIAPDYLETGIGTTNGITDLERRLGKPFPAGVPRSKVVSQTVYAHAPYVLLLQDREVPDPRQRGTSQKMNVIEMVTVYDGTIHEHRMFFPEGHVPRNQPQTDQERRNIAAVRHFMHEMWIPRDGRVAPKYIAWGFIEHGNGNENATNGRADIVRRFGHPPPAGTPQQELTSETYYARGPIVLLLQDRMGPDSKQPGKTRATRSIAMYEVYDGQLQEHWLLTPQEHDVWGD